MNDHAKGAAMLGCSTSGEILGDMVADDSVIATSHLYSLQAVPL